MMRIRKGFRLFFIIGIIIPAAAGASGVLLNGTSIYVTMGDSYVLYQGYILSVKSVSGDGSVWLQLTLDDAIVKSDIASIHENFIYNKTDKTILSIHVNNVYSGSGGQSLVSLFPVYQFIDPDLPQPVQIGITPYGNQSQKNDNPPARIYTPGEPVILILGIFFVVLLFYSLHKLW